MLATVYIPLVKDVFLVQARVCVCVCVCECVCACVRVRACVCARVRARVFLVCFLSFIYFCKAPCAPSQLKTVALAILSPYAVYL